MPHQQPLIDDDAVALNRNDLQRMPAYCNAIKRCFYDPSARLDCSYGSGSYSRESNRTFHHPPTYSHVFELEYVVHGHHPITIRWIWRSVPASLHAVRPIDLSSNGRWSSRAEPLPQRGSANFCGIVLLKDWFCLYARTTLADFRPRIRNKRFLGRQAVQPDLPGVHLNFQLGIMAAGLLPSVTVLVGQERHRCQLYVRIGKDARAGLSLELPHVRVNL